MCVLPDGRCVRVARVHNACIAVFKQLAGRLHSTADPHVISTWVRVGRTGPLPIGR